MKEIVKTIDEIIMLLFSSVKDLIYGLIEKIVQNTQIQILESRKTNNIDFKPKNKPKNPSPSPKTIDTETLSTK